MVNILVLSDSLADTDGVGCMTYEVLRAWRAQHPELERVRLWLARGHPRHDPARARDLEVDVVLPPDDWLNRSRAGDWSQRLRTWWTLRRKRDDRLAPRFVFSFKDFPHAYVGFTEALRRGVPFCSVAHGTYAVRALEQRHHRARALRMMTDATATIAVSDHTRERLLRAAHAASRCRPRVRVVAHGCDPDLAHTTVPADTGVMPWRRHVTVATIAACKERKGLGLAFDAFALVAREHREVHWCIVGNPHLETAHAREVRARVRTSGLEDRVHWLGVIDHAHKVDLLRRARLHLFTPTGTADGAFEGFGLPYLEAAVMGTPSIGTLGSGAEQALADPELGYLVKPRPEAVAARMRDVLGAGADETGRERIAAAALRRTWQDVARELWMLARG